MRKIITIFIFLLSFIPKAFAAPSHLEKLKSRYPYGLIGDDYGILNEEDIAINDCKAEATPFSRGKNLSYSYWQCFSVIDSKITCDSTGYDSLTKMETGYVEINAKKGDEIHFYLARDPMKIRDCKAWIRTWLKRTILEKYVCISGIDNGSHADQKDRKERYWVFDRFKTRKGCEAYKSECHLPKHPGKNCTLPANDSV